MANYDLSKVMSLADGQVMYKDLRDRYDPKYEKPATGIPATDLAAGVIPTIPVTDVQTNGTSILNNGVANIPIAGANDLGLVKINNQWGIALESSTGKLYINAAGSSDIKGGINAYKPIVPNTLRESIYYGLSNLAGVYIGDRNNLVLGQYPNDSKQAIQKMLGFDGILGDFENSAVASKAYAIGETFIYNGKRYRATAAIAISDVITPGTNCELEPLNLAYIPKNAIDEYSGLYVKSNGKIAILASDTNVIKVGANNSRPITAYTAKDAAFYGLAKAANDSTQASSSNPVGTYTTEAKTAIQTMLGIEADIPLIEEVSGSTPSITGMPNVRYICGTCSLLTITPPASGSIVIRFTSGSTPTVLTVPNTVKFPIWFDYTSLEADTTYEIIITDGVYGGVMSWA